MPIGIILANVEKIVRIRGVLGLNSEVLKWQKEIEMNKEEQIALLERLSNAPGTSGFEEEVAQIVSEEISELGEVYTDSILNVYLDRDDSDDEKPMVIFDAHMDEVGFIVQSINANGSLKFLPVGGWIPASVAAQKVKVRNKQGEYISGVIASKPPHYSSAEERSKGPDISDMQIDLGTSSKEETESVFQVRLAAPIVPDVTFEKIKSKEDWFIGKAFDCRIGVAAEILALRELKDVDLDVNLSAVFSTQEEVGTRGIQVAANHIEADLAICFEGAPADDTFGDSSSQQTVLGKGPMLRHFDSTMITNPRFQRFALDVAEEEGIPVQEGVRTGGGTNGKVLHLANQGIPTIVIGVPVRYIHSHYGIACYEDYINAARLASAIVKKLDANAIETF